MRQRHARTLWAYAVMALLGACGAAPDEGEGDEFDPAVLESELTIGPPVTCDVIQAKRWRTPVRIGFDTAGYMSLPPKIATSANGNAAAIWLEYVNNNTYNVRTNRYFRPAGSLLASWQAQSDVIGTFSHDAGNFFPVSPTLAMDGTGGAMALWVEYVGTTTYNVKARRFTPAAGWGATAQLGTSSSFFPPSFEVAMDSSGNAIAVWERQQSQSLSDIDFARFTGTWGSAAPLENGAGNARTPTIAAGPNGTMVAGWIQFDVERSVYSRRFDLASAWGAITRIDSAYDGIGAAGPRIAMNANGAAAVCWSVEHNNGTFDVYSNVSTGAGAWAGAHPLVANVTGAPRVDYGVSIDDSGNAAVAWHRHDGSPINVYARRLLPGGVPDATVSTLDTRSEDALHPEIDMDTNGNGIVVWLQSNGTSNSIYASHLSHRLPSRGCPEQWSWSSPVSVEATTNQAQRPRISMSPNGSAVAVWKQYDSGGEGVWAAHFQ